MSCELININDINKLKYELKGILNPDQFKVSQLIRRLRTYYSEPPCNFQTDVLT